MICTSLFFYRALKLPRGASVYIVHSPLQPFADFFGQIYTVSLSWKQRYLTFYYLTYSALFYPHLNLKNINPSFEYMISLDFLLSPFYEGHKEYTFSSMIHITQPLLDHIFSALRHSANTKKHKRCCLHAISDKGCVIRQFYNEKTPLTRLRKICSKCELFSWKLRCYRTRELARALIRTDTDTTQPYIATATVIKHKEWDDHNIEHKVYNTLKIKKSFVPCK